MRGDVRQADLILGWRGVPVLHPDETALELAATVLSAGRASRLYRALREPGVVSSVGAWSYTPTEVGVFGVSMDLDPIRVPEAVRIVAQQIGALAATGPEPEAALTAPAICVRCLPIHRHVSPFDVNLGESFEQAG